MGYDFSFERAGKDDSFRFNTGEMDLMRMIMLEAGAVVGRGFKQALTSDNLDFKPSDASVPMKKFQSNSDWHVTTEECRLIAERVEKALAAGLVDELFSFYDDDREFLNSVRERVAPWADYNRRAADHGGYRVR